MRKVRVMLDPREAFFRAGGYDVPVFDESAGRVVRMIQAQDAHRCLASLLGGRAPLSLSKGGRRRRGCGVCSAARIAARDVWG